ncbi:uncharacterized protein TEOVI_000046500 [Trypanosoma equiperdum]|uniref:Uncharacterized protein n=2 Tax=Trypanozoon TaxID=39700 RepID=Q38FW5_TRYB2|nr:hypothetical protein, conserved [Trypanosoma brucei brucei TREU927]EAN76305.1 hypothetical protein, conserved [Trypanosoma brucei brucei TREU927]SCU67505.1 hypothetical protein, conserved [Trypanosoma equiperdum]
MHSRRIFGSAAIPLAMYTKLRICSQAQARRRLPSLVPLLPAMATATRSVIPLVQSTTPTMPMLETAEFDPVLLSNYLECIAPMRVGFLRLMELWGIGRMVMSCFFPKMR